MKRDQNETEATTEDPVIPAVKLASSTQPSERKFLDPIKTFDVSNKTKTLFLKNASLFPKYQIATRNVRSNITPKTIVK